MITYRKYSNGGPQAIKAAQSALDARLYVRRYGTLSMMKQWLRRIAHANTGLVNRASNFTLAVAYDNSEPVGCAIDNGYSFIIYVKVSHRRNGIGSKLCETMRIGDKSFEVYDTTTGARFWSKLMKSHKGLKWAYT